MRSNTTRTRGAMPLGTLGILFLVPALFVLGLGIKNMITSSRNSVCTTLTYSEFARQLPKSGWYKVTGTVLDVANSVYWEQNGVPIDVFAPVRPVTGRDTAAGDIYVELTDPKTLSGFMDLNSARRSGGEVGARNDALKHTDVFLQKRDISGLVTFGHRDPVGEWSKLGLDAANLTFIQDGWIPKTSLAYFETVVGLVFVLTCIGMMSKKHRYRRV